eukprot:scaffold706_cov418-Prasinococcus_capsulatus_cf.AAC.29
MSCDSLSGSTRQLDKREAWRKIAACGSDVEKSAYSSGRWTLAHAHWLKGSACSVSLLEPGIDSCACCASWRRLEWKAEETRPRRYTHSKAPSSARGSLARKLRIRVRRDSAMTLWPVRELWKSLPSCGISHACQACSPPPAWGLVVTASRCTALSCKSARMPPYLYARVNTSRVVPSSTAPRPPHLTSARGCERHAPRRLDGQH